MRKILNTLAPSPLNFWGIVKSNYMVKVNTKLCLYAKWICLLFQCFFSFFYSLRSFFIVKSVPLTMFFQSLYKLCWTYSLIYFVTNMMNFSVTKPLNKELWYSIVSTTYYNYIYIYIYKERERESIKFNKVKKTTKKLNHHLTKW
jgi:hypothetical protein